MRCVLISLATLGTGLAGGILGWWAGVAMDRFRWLAWIPMDLKSPKASAVEVRFCPAFPK